MRSERTLHFRVGMFVTAGLVLCMFVILMIGSRRAWFEERYTLNATFDNISGIGPGAGVMLAGMNVGSVASVQFPEDLAATDVRVVLRINPVFQDRIRGDSEASIVTQGLLGDKKISITVGSAKAEPLQDGDELGTAPAGDLYSIGKGASDVMADARKVLKRLDELLRDAQEGKGALHALVYDEQGGELVQNLNVGAASFRKFMQTAVREGDLSTVLANLDEAALDVKSITGQIRRGEGTLGALLTDDAIYNDLRSIFGRAERNVLLKSLVRSMIRASDRAAEAAE
jgi:phospholipid/cholesterol/gamma-HCH transport system substrate-binding protein